MEYSGRTSCSGHKHGDAWKDTPGAGKEAIQMKKVVEAQWSNMPIEIYNIVSHLWGYWELGNDYYYQPITPSEIFEHGTNEDGVIESKEWKWGETEEEKLGWVAGDIDVKPFAQWMLDSGIGKDETVLVHYWW